MMPAVEFEAAEFKSSDVLSAVRLGLEAAT
jgi:hypothetical protein